MTRKKLYIFIIIALAAAAVIFFVSKKEKTPETKDPQTDPQYTSEENNTTDTEPEILYQVRLLSNINIRTSPSTSGDIVILLPADTIVNVYEEQQNEGYLWRRINENQWIADDGTWLEIIENTQSDEYTEPGEINFSKAMNLLGKTIGKAVSSCGEYSYTRPKKQGGEPCISWNDTFSFWYGRPSAKDEKTIEHSYSEPQNDMILGGFYVNDLSAPLYCGITDEDTPETAKKKIGQEFTSVDNGPGYIFAQLISGSCSIDFMFSKETKKLTSIAVYFRP